MLLIITKSITVQLRKCYFLPDESDSVTVSVHGRGDVTGVGEEHLICEMEVQGINRYKLLI